MTLQEKLNLSDSALNKKVFVAGTDYDRRRKLTNREIYNIKRSYENTSRDINYLAEKYSVTPSTIRYHVDPVYRSYTNVKRKEYSFSEPVKGYKEDLANYKRDLMRLGKRLPVSE